MPSSPPAPDLVQLVFDLYSSTKFKPPNRQHTVLSAFILENKLLREIKVISLATGTKCLPAARLPLNGEALHDSHAEVLARRGAIRWFLEEISRCETSRILNPSAWIVKQIPSPAPVEDRQSGVYALREGVSVTLYISTPPCGDASTRYLASFQDPVMAALKDSVKPLIPDTTAGAAIAPTSDGTGTSKMAAPMISRGRDNYSLLGVLRTKPGRADSPPTSCMSCSDKIASWQVLGFQGCLASRFFESPLYVSKILIGEVQNGAEGEAAATLREVTFEDCERALWKRIDEVEGFASQLHLHGSFTLHKPQIEFDPRIFIHSRLAQLPHDEGSSNDSLSWIADSERIGAEVLINGFKRGVSPTHRLREKSRPRTSQIAMYALYRRAAELLLLSSSSSQDQPSSSMNATYLEEKRSRHCQPYRSAKVALMEVDGAPFGGWIRTSSSTGNFILP